VETAHRAPVAGTVKLAITNQVTMTAHLLTLAMIAAESACWTKIVMVSAVAQLLMIRVMFAEATVRHAQRTSVRLVLSIVRVTAMVLLSSTSAMCATAMVHLVCILAALMDLIVLVFAVVSPSLTSAVFAVASAPLAPTVGAGRAIKLSIAPVSARAPTKKTIAVFVAATVHRAKVVSVTMAQLIATAFVTAPLLKMSAVSAMEVALPAQRRPVNQDLTIAMRSVTAPQLWTTVVSVAEAVTAANCVATLMPAMLRVTCHVPSLRPATIATEAACSTLIAKEHVAERRLKMNAEFATEILHLARGASTVERAIMWLRKWMTLPSTIACIRIRSWWIAKATASSMSTATMCAEALVLRMVAVCAKLQMTIPYTMTAPVRASGLQMKMPAEFAAETRRRALDARTPMLAITTSLQRLIVSCAGTQTVIVSTVGTHARAALIALENAAEALSLIRATFVAAMARPVTALMIATLLIVREPATVLLRLTIATFAAVTLLRAQVA